MGLEISIDDGPLRDVAVTRTGPHAASVWIEGMEHRVVLRPVGRGYEISVDDRSEPLWLVVDHDTVFIHMLGRAWRTEVVDPVGRAAMQADETDVATAPMPGTVITVAVAAGEEVSVGQPLVVIESMKMQSEIVAWRDGVVDRVHLQVGETFDRGAGLVALVPETEEESGG